MSNTVDNKGIRLTAVAAVDDAGALGRESKLPWHLPQELAYFKELTWGKHLLMGRKTFASMDSMPLPGRKTTVLTHNYQWQPPGGVSVVYTLEQALRLALEEEVMVCGGGEVYRQLLPYCGLLYLSRIPLKVPRADTFFPPLEAPWEKIEAKAQEGFMAEVWRNNAFKN